MIFSKNRIKFYCSLPEIKEKYPITPAKDFNFNWFRNSALAFKKVSGEIGQKTAVTGAAKCPGIRPIMQNGVILRSWFDLTINTNKDPNNFDFFIPPGIGTYLQGRQFNKKLVSWFTPDDQAHATPVHESSLQTLIKITTPWSVAIPKGWKLLFMPIPYPDEPEFTAVHGMLSAGDYYPINAIINVHRRPGELHIPAGTPLMQMIPVKDEDIAVDVLDMTEAVRNLELKNDYNANHTFIVNHKS
jgi:hypothetical protein